MLTHRLIDKYTDKVVGFVIHGVCVRYKDMMSLLERVGLSMPEDVESGIENILVSENSYSEIEISLSDNSIHGNQLISLLTGDYSGTSPQKCTYKMSLSESESVCWFVGNMCMTIINTCSRQKMKLEDEFKRLADDLYSRYTDVLDDMSKGEFSDKLIALCLGYDDSNSMECNDSVLSESDNEFINEILNESESYIV